eukprot:Em0019g257a
MRSNVFAVSCIHHNHLCNVFVEFCHRAHLRVRCSSYLATTVRSAPVVALEDEVDHFSKKPSNSDETGPGEHTREGDHRLKEELFRVADVDIDAADAPDDQSETQSTGKVHVLKNYTERWFCINMSGAAAQGQQPPQQAAPASKWHILRSLLFQMAIFYFVTSFFRKQSAPTQTQPDGSPVKPGFNTFPNLQEMDLHVFLTEFPEFEVQRDRSSVVWSEEGLRYGNWNDGPQKDGSRYKTLDVSVPESVQQNGSWYIHVFCVKSGFSLDPNDEDYSPNAMAHSMKPMNKYRKRRVHNTANLITGQAEVAPGALKVPRGTVGVTPDVISYYHTNLTLNIVDDQTAWTKGSVPVPFDQYIKFDEAGGYSPVVYINDYWNLAQDYQPLNETTKNVTLNMVFAPLALFKFQMYVSMTKQNTWNTWSQSLGGTDPTDEDQDTLKQTLLDTNPYLLGLTVAVSILHSVFEFLAFKNDVQFWRSRKSLEGLSVRSVFFNVFQSLVVLLYILDNETNMIVIISVFIGLCIDFWKVTKVVNIRLDRENLIAGVLPRIVLVDMPSYTQSSTKQYDMLAFRYLSWLLFPLFLCYGVYSLLYHEHKGWYSFVLTMCYGFLLTFGFITMTPQLFINYKLKSVAHLPWRMLTYKALNTFIDDMFAFVIKMPTMYRIGCFRDDIVFFIFLYQRWIYRVDPKRVNEFGTSGEDTTPVEAEAEGNALEERPGDHSSEQGSKSAVDKKQD